MTMQLPAKESYLTEGWEGRSGSQQSAQTTNHNDKNQGAVARTHRLFEPLCYSRGMSSVCLCDAIKLWAWLKVPPCGCCWTCLPLAGQKNMPLQQSTHILLCDVRGCATVIQGSNVTEVYAWVITHSMYRLLMAMKLVLDEKGPQLVSSTHNHHYGIAWLHSHLWMLHTADSDVHHVTDAGIVYLRLTSPTCSAHNGQSRWVVLG